MPLALPDLNRLNLREQYHAPVPSCIASRMETQSSGLRIFIFPLCRPEAMVWTIWTVTRTKQLDNMLYLFTRMLDIPLHRQAIRGGLATAQSSADNSPSLDSPSIDAELLMEAPKPQGQGLPMTMANSTVDPLASPVPEPFTDSDVLVGTPAYKRGRGEIDGPVSVDSSNHQAVPQLHERTWRTLPAAFVTTSLAVLHL